jgi:hypothetical protein
VQHLPDGRLGVAVVVEADRHEQLLRRANLERIDDEVRGAPAARRLAVLEIPDLIEVGLVPGGLPSKAVAGQDLADDRVGHRAIVTRSGGP